MTDVETFDPSEWLASQTHVDRYEINMLLPAMWFALIWNRFELKTCDRDASIISIEKSLAAASNSGFLHWKNFEDFWISLKSYLDSTGAIGNLEFFLLSDKKPRTNEKERVKNLLCTLNTDSPEMKSAIMGMLFVAYRVRNNLFHGEKCVTSLPHQSPLFRILNAFLAKYIEVTSHS